jgi:hypothetical protein
MLKLSIISQLQLFSIITIFKLKDKQRLTHGYRAAAYILQNMLLTNAALFPENIPLWLYSSFVGPWQLFGLFNISHKSFQRGC